MHFFLGSDGEFEDSDESDDDVGSCLTKQILSSLHLYQTINVKSLEHKRGVKKRHAAVTRGCTRCSRRRAKFGRFYSSYASSDACFQKRKRKDAGITTNFPTLQLLHDPKTFGEKLYDLLQKFDARFLLDRKIIIMQLLAHVTALHRLSILGFYTYVLKYLTHHQLRAPAILAVLA